MIRNAQHWTDFPLGGRSHRRVLSNWLNYQEPGGSWETSAPGAVTAPGVPPNWSGVFDFTYQSAQAPLQCFFRDALDPNNRAMVGARLCDRPSCWVNFKAVAGSSVDAVVEESGLAIRWPDLWSDCDLIYRPGRGKIQKEIVCKASGHPIVFEFTVQLAPQCTLVFEAGHAIIQDDTGTTVLVVLAPFAHDSTAPEPKPIGVTMTEGAPVAGRQVIRLELDQADLVAAVYPIIVDPTVIISGTTDIEDNMMQSTGLPINYGLRPFLDIALVLGVLGDTRRSLVRVKGSAIPNEVISGFRWLVWRVSSAGEVAAGILDLFRIVDANIWVEGTGPVFGAVENGSSCWRQAKLNALNWAGGIDSGCGVIGTDTDASAGASEPYAPFTTGPDVLHTVSLPPSWAEDWRDGVRVDNGFMVKGRDEVTVGNLFFARSSEAGTNPVTFEIDFDVGVAPIAAMNLKRKID